jgi:hypothetical protein
MTCAEFQKVLPFIFESGGRPEEEEHLKTCPICSDLVADLKYIADQAKLLVPMEDPHPRVWKGIQKSLEREGIGKRPTGPRGRLLEFPRMGAVPKVAATTAIALVVLGLALYRRGDSRATDSATALPPAAYDYRVAGNSADDARVLSAVAERAPALRSVYEESLQRVNAYIADAGRRVEADPGDEDARQHLLLAYEQKTMLYEMALRRSLP